MAKNDIYKTFISKPIAILDPDGTILDQNKEIALIAKDVQFVSNIAAENVNTTMLSRYLHAKEELTQLNEIGRIIGITIPKEEKAKHFQHLKGKRATGFSRLEKMVCDRTVRELSNWAERIDASLGTTKKYMSQGWKRTINSNKLDNLKPKMSLSATDSQYSEIFNLTTNSFELKMIIGGKKRVLAFNYDGERFKDAYKITKPDITLNSHGYPVFSFTAAYSPQYVNFSKQYVIGIDVGLNQYATVSVYDIQNDKVVETITLSKRVHSLHNKVRRSNTQVASLQHQGRKIEARSHREANSRRKRELAIVAAQEIALLSYNYDNALVSFEDLTWVHNTMQNGRWNRGELFKWTEHFVELNGGRVTKVSAAYTSTTCSHCGNNLFSYKSSYVFKECLNCHTIWDRDVNASINIAKKLAYNDKYGKYVETRSKSKNLVSKARKRSGNGLPVVLKTPGRDRVKHIPTPKQVRKRRVNKINMKREVFLAVKNNHGSASATFSSPKCRVLAVSSKKLETTSSQHKIFQDNKTNNTSLT